MSLDLVALQAFPKVCLHDHLDGALRPQTIIDLAAEVGHALPADTADDLGRWFAAAADSGSLERYLETFLGVHAFDRRAFVLLGRVHRG